MPNRTISSKSSRRKLAPIVSGRTPWKRWAITIVISPPRPRWCCGFGSGAFCAGTVASASVACRSLRSRIGRLTPRPSPRGLTARGYAPKLQRWSELIGGYWRRFETHLPVLRAAGGQRVWSAAAPAHGPRLLAATARALRRSGQGDAPTHPSVPYLFVRNLPLPPASAASGCIRAARAGARRRLTPTDLYYRGLWGPGPKLLRV